MVMLVRVWYLILLLFCTCNLLCCVVTAEKRSPQKPQRFSTCFPDSQELMEIRTKKKVRRVDFPPFARISCYALMVLPPSPVVDSRHRAVQPEAKEGDPVLAGERPPPQPHGRQPNSSVAQRKSPTGQEDDWRVHQWSKKCRASWLLC